MDGLSPCRPQFSFKLAVFADYSQQTPGADPATLPGMLGKELKKAREAAGLSQEKLGFEARVDRSYVSLLENDKKSPTLDVLFRLCDALRISAAELIGRVEKARAASATARFMKKHR